MEAVERAVGQPGKIWSTFSQEENLDTLKDRIITFCGQADREVLLFIVVFYGKKVYILELKIWHGPKRLSEGLEQLAEYMDSRGQTQGWLLTFCFEAGYTREINDLAGKTIYSVVV